MARRKLDSRFGLLVVSSLAACVVQVGGCASNDGGIATEEGGSSTGGRTGGAPSDTGGSVATGGNGATGGTPSEAGAGNAPDGGTAQGGAPVTGGSTATGGVTDGGSQPGTGGTPVAAGAGGAEGGAWATGGSGGGTGTDAGAGGDDTGVKRCVYFSEGAEVIDADGAGGASPMPTITMPKNGFAGTYLADSAGKALYTYGADAPGDCDYPPITNCFKDCAIAWPPFNGEPRLLAAGLDDSLFGSIQRTDTTTAGDVTTSQTTYQGWPLYYYKSDLNPGDVKGQAVGKLWALAQVTLPNIVVMRTDVVKFLADEHGHTLYSSAADTPGTMTKSPVSACTGSCLDDFEPFVLNYLSPVTYILASDLSYFVRGDGTQQIAYKGWPLYRSHADLRSAQTNGTAIPGFSVAPL